jgi:hypothetical protein
LRIRPLAPADVDGAALLLQDAYTRAKAPLPPLASIDGGLVADEGGVVVGVGFARRRGEVAVVGPIASAAWGNKIGGAVLDALIAQADEWGCAAVRAFLSGANPDAFALFAGRAFVAVDVVTVCERPAGAPPKIDSSRGLEITPFKPADLDEIAALDAKLTGLERREDLEARLKLVARRRGAVAGYVGASGALLGPALALDVPDLATLVGRALADVKERAAMRLSTAAPTAVLAALGLGFRISAIGHVLSRGVAPPARPPQLYSIDPEIA